MSFLRLNELNKLGLRKIGNNVKISRFTQFYNPQNITIGDNVRIDDFCLISKGKYINIGNYVHIASHCGLWGNNGIKISDFCGISSGCKLYSESDDFLGYSLTGPTIPSQYKDESKMVKGKILLDKHVIIGTNSIILPGVTIKEGCAIGCGSLINGNCQEWSIYVGNPVRYIKERHKNLLIYEERLVGSI